MFRITEVVFFFQNYFSVVDIFISNQSPISSISFFEIHQNIVSFVISPYSTSQIYNNRNTGRTKVITRHVVLLASVCVNSWPLSNNFEKRKNNFTKTSNDVGLFERFRTHVRNWFLTLGRKLIKNVFRQRPYILYIYTTATRIIVRVKSFVS